MADKTKVIDCNFVRVSECVTAFLALTTLILTPAFADAPASFQVNGAVTAPRTWTVDALKQQFAAQLTTIKYTMKGEQHTAHAIPLVAILQNSQPVAKPRVKLAVLQDTVAVTGTDSYTVIFSMGELLPEFGNEPVWVAIDEDGKPLDADHGPVELVVPNDQKGARSVHAIATITVAAPN